MVKPLTKEQKKQAIVNAQKAKSLTKNLQKIQGRIIDYEGLWKTPYLDNGRISIGFGHVIKPGENLTHVSDIQALSILKKDIAERQRKTNQFLDQNNIKSFSPSQKEAMAEMMYQIGDDAPNLFVKTINKIKRKELDPNSIKPEEIFKEALDSKWFRHDSPVRAVDVAARLTGVSADSDLYKEYLTAANSPKMGIGSKIEGYPTKKSLTYTEFEDLDPNQLETLVKFAKSPSDDHTKSLFASFDQDDRSRGIIKDIEPKENINTKVEEPLKEVPQYIETKKEEELPQSSLVAQENNKDTNLPNIIKQPDTNLVENITSTTNPEENKSEIFMDGGMKRKYAEGGDGEVDDLDMSESAGIDPSTENLTTLTQSEPDYSLPTETPQPTSFDDNMRKQLDAMVSDKGEAERQKELSDARSSDQLNRLVSNANIIFGTGKPSFNESEEDKVQFDRKNKLQELQGIQKAYHDLRIAAGGMKTEELASYLKKMYPDMPIPEGASKAELMKLTGIYTKEKNTERALGLKNDTMQLKAAGVLNRLEQSDELPSTAKDLVQKNEAQIQMLNHLEELLKDPSAKRYMGPVQSTVYEKISRYGGNVPKKFTELNAYMGEGLAETLKNLSGVSFRPEEVENVKKFMPSMSNDPKVALNIIKTRIQKLKESSDSIIKSNSKIQKIGEYPDVLNRVLGKNQKESSQLPVEQQAKPIQSQPYRVKQNNKIYILQDGKYVEEK